MIFKIKFPIEEKGGPGSGFHGHAGRPGHIGGSSGEGGSGSGSGGSGSGANSDADARFARRQEQAKQAKQVRSKLKALGRRTNEWSARDTIMNLANDVLGTDYVSLGGKDGQRTARRLIKEMTELPDAVIMNALYNNERNATRLGL